MFRRRPTKIQAVMASLVGGAFLLLIAFLVPETRGILSSAVEDTLSEWVWDLPLGWVISISVLFAVAALALAWAGIHFIEGWILRRSIERAKRK